MPQLDTPSSASQPLRFPAQFAFGVATAAHQVEGNNDLSDWWDFEQIPGHIHDGSRSGLACDHYRRYEEDLDLLAPLNASAYRFSLEWARIEPEPGRFDLGVLEHYRNVLLACRRRGIEPCVTLYHFTLPRWFAARGGWLRSDAPALFRRYVSQVVTALGDLVRWWVTLNEPMVYLFFGYLDGIWPPGRHSFPELVRAGRSLIHAHHGAFNVLRSTPGFGGVLPEVGIAQHFRVFDPARDGNRLDSFAAAAQDALFNWSFLDAVHRGQLRPPFGVGGTVSGFNGSAHTFVGVNYYSRGRVRFSPRAAATLFGVQETTPGAPTNDLGWELYPEGLTRTLRAAHRRYGLPMWITENGTADREDRFRSSFLRHHLAQTAVALNEGIPVLGYFHWSLYDNFEWAEGYSARFGLYHVDYESQVRTLRPSGQTFAQIATTREIPLETLSAAPL